MGGKGEEALVMEYIQRAVNHEVDSDMKSKRGKKDKQLESNEKSKRAKGKNFLCGGIHSERER